MVRIIITNNNITYTKMSEPDTANSFRIIVIGNNLHRRVHAVHLHIIIIIHKVYIIGIKQLGKHGKPCGQTL